MANIIDRVDVLLSQFKSLQPLKDEDQKKLDKKFRLEFNFNSNHIEGNTLTYSETELLLIFEDTKGSHTLREYDEMRAHDAALKLITEWAIEKDRPLTEQNIKNLNEIILVRPFWKDAITLDGQNTRRLIEIGNYKKHPNSVRLQNGEMFDYASPADTPILMQELIDWYRREENSIHPITLAAMLHYKFVRIHPFDDGNGRVARLLMNYVLLRNNYPPAIIRSDDKVNYLRVLRLADVEDYEPLITYISEQVVWSLQISIKAAKGQSIDEPGDLDKKIKTLKQRLNTDVNAKVTVTKSAVAIKTAYQFGIQSVILSLSEKLSELNAIFKSTKEKMVAITSKGNNFRIESGIPSFNQGIDSISNNYSIDSIQYSYSFEHLRKSKKPFSIVVFIGFIFHTNVYEIKSDCVKTQIEKLYDENFSESEISLIVEEVGNFVTEGIERALDS